MTLNEDSLRASGFVTNGKGVWWKPDIHARRGGTIAKLEPDSRDGNLAPIPVQKTTGGRILVRVTSFRRRLLDEDNLCEKYHVDLCRYAGTLSSDSAGKAKIEVAQQKVGSKEKEFVRIEVYTD